MEIPPAHDFPPAPLYSIRDFFPHLLSEPQMNTDKHKSKEKPEARASIRTSDYLCLSVFIRGFNLFLSFAAVSRPIF
jgi:hypothetical protein